MTNKHKPCLILSVIPLTCSELLSKHTARTRIDFLVTVFQEPYPVQCRVRCENCRPSLWLNYVPALGYNGEPGPTRNLSQTAFSRQNLLLRECAHGVVRNWCKAACNATFTVLTGTLS